MLKKIFLLLSFFLIFFISFYSDLFQVLINYESNNLTKFFKYSKIKQNDFVIVNVKNNELNQIISNIDDSQNIIFDCFTDFDGISFTGSKKHYSSFIYMNSDNINAQYSKNNYSFLMNKNKPSSLTKIIPNDLTNINASGFFEFNKTNGNYYFKLLDKFNNKVVFSLPLAIYLSQTNFKKIELTNDYLRIIKETTGSDIYIYFLKDYYINLGSKIFDITKINYSKSESLKKYKNIILSKCNDYNSNREKLLAMAISNIQNKVFVPKFFSSLSLLIIILFLIFCVLINFIKLKYYKVVLLFLLILSYVIFALFSYKYAQIHLPILFSICFGVLSYYFFCYFFVKSKKNIVYEGQALLMYSSFNKIDFTDDVFNPEVINVINNFWSEFEKFIIKTGGINVFTSSKSRLCFWPDDILSKINFEEDLVNIKEKYTKTLASIDEGFIKKFKPQLIIDYGKIYFDSKSKASYGQIINRVQGLAKINKKYSSYVLLSDIAYDKINRENVFYPIDINLYILDWEIKFDIKEYLVYFNSFKENIDEEGLALFGKLIENDENQSFKILYQKLKSLINCKLGD